MQYNEFVGQVQNRARLASSGEAVHAIRATLQTLGERLFGGETEHLAAQLPEEISVYLHMAERKGSFSLDEFFARVAKSEGIDLPDAVYHARAVISVLKEAVTPGEMADVRAQLPKDYDPLFEAGHEGEMERSS